MKSWPIWCSKLLNKIGRNFFNIQYWTLLFFNTTFLTVKYTFLCYNPKFSRTWKIRRSESYLRQIKVEIIIIKFWIFWFIEAKKQGKTLSINFTNFWHLKSRKFPRFTNWSYSICNAYYKINQIWSIRTYFYEVGDPFVKIWFGGKRRVWPFKT